MFQDQPATRFCRQILSNFAVIVSQLEWVAQAWVRGRAPQFQPSLPFCRCDPPAPQLADASSVSPMATGAARAHPFPTPAEFRRFCVPPSAECPQNGINFTNFLALAMRCHPPCRQGERQTRINPPSSRALRLKAGCVGVRGRGERDGAGGRTRTDTPCGNRV